MTSWIVQQLQQLLQQLANDLPRHFSYEARKVVVEWFEHRDNHETVQQVGKDRTALNELVAQVLSNAGHRVPAEAIKREPVRSPKKYKCPPGRPIKGTVYGTYILPNDRLYLETKPEG